MNLTTKKVPLIILGVTAVILTRTMFWFFDDPEGPNLLVVFVGAVILYIPSLLLFLKTRFSNQQKLVLAIGMQVLEAIVLYLLLR